MAHVQRLPSENVVISAPMSFAGSAARIWKITLGRSGWPLAGMVTLAVLAIIVAWSAVLSWYAIFGVLLVPWRVLRRGQRKRKRDAARHRELMGR